MSWALTGARACWHHGLEVERHSHRKAVEELLVLLIWFGSWGLADSLNVAGSSQDTPWSGSAFQTMQKSIFSLRCFSFSLFIYILNSNTQLLRSMSACCFLVEWLVLESQTHVGWCSFSSPADLMSCPLHCGNRSAWVSLGKIVGSPSCPGASRPFTAPKWCTAVKNVAYCS